MEEKVDPPPPIFVKSEEELAGEALRREFEEIIAKVDSYPIHKEHNDGRTKVRKTVSDPESGRELIVLESRDYGITPEEFIGAIKDVAHFVKANGRRSRAAFVLSTHPTSYGGVIETFASLGKSVGPISGRMFVDTRHVWLKDCMVISSSRGT